MARTRPPTSGSPPLVEELEARLMLSADLQPIALDDASLDVGPEPMAHVELVGSGALSPSREVEVREEVVFVDAGVGHRDALIDELRRASPAGRALEVFLLDGDADGVAQIADFLADREQLDAVHVISHGAQGALQLGNTWLDGGNLGAYADRLGEWGEALGGEADLLFYGCDLAGGEAGAGFVEALGKLTGADVAASVDATGADVLGGDWELEHRVGDVETAAAFGSLDVAWQGVLANQPPVNSLPATQVTAVDTQLLLSDASGNGISVSDPDAAGAEIELTLQVSHGTITVAGPGDPIDVNSETTMAQTTPRVARDLAGNTVVVWASQDQDADGLGIFGQRYDTAGNPVGSEFQINSEELGDQARPAVAMDDDGDFVVVWQSFGQDGDSWGIHGQRYDASGNAVGSEFQVSSATADAQSDADVAMDAAGNFLVVWQSTGQDGDGDGIYAQRFDASGAAVGTEFQVHTGASGDQSAPSVALDANGDAVVVWQDYDGTTGSWGVYGQRFDAAGVAQGGQFLVNSWTLGELANPDVAMDDAGNFVVAWQSQGQDGSGWGVFAQRFDAAGSALGSEFQVNSTTTQEQSAPAVAMDADGDFAITWQGKPGNFDIYLQQFEADGTPVGTQTQVNAFAGGDQLAPDIAMDGDGDHFVVWEGKAGGSATDEVQGSHVSYAKNITYVSGDGIDDALLVMRGTIADLNEALDGMIFTPTAGFVGDATIDITSDDLGNTGGGNATDTDQLIIRVGTPGNAAPVLDAGADLVLGDVFEDASDPAGDTVAALLGSAGTDPIFDADGDPEGIAVVGVDDANGTWEYSTDAGGSWLAFGAVSDANAVLLDGAARVRFVPDPDYAGPAGELAFRAWDQTQGAPGDTGVAIGASGGTTPYSDATETATLTVLAANDAPMHTVPGAQTTAEDTELLFSVATANPIRVGDVDAAELEVRLTATGGTLTLAGTSGLVFSAGDGVADPTMTVRGSEGAINAALDGLRFQPTPDSSGAASLRIETSDLGGAGAGPAGSADDTVAIDVSAVNDAPVHWLPGVQVTDDASAVVFSLATGNPIRVSDIDSGTVQVTLRAANGTVTLGSLVGLSFGAGDGTSDDVVTFAGSQSAVNAALDGLRFQAGAGFSGAAAVEITSDDLGVGGAGGPQTATDTISITVGFVEVEPHGEDAPVEEEPEVGAAPAESTGDPAPAVQGAPGLDAFGERRPSGPRLGDFVPIELPASELEPPEAPPIPSAPVEAPLAQRSEARGRGDEPGDERPSLPRDRALSTLMLGHSLDDLRADLGGEAAAEQAEHETVFASVRAMALAVSTGSLAALLRGGSLLALTFSSLPLWNGFDPLAVLAMSSAERKRREDELRAEQEAEDSAVARLFDPR